MIKRLFPFLLAVLLLPIAAVVRADSLGAGFFDDTVPLITSSGCSLATSGIFYDGTYLNCPATAVVSFDFYGSEFAVWSERGADGGDKNVCVDGNCTIISNFNATTVLGEWFRVSDLSVGTHTVSITNQVGAWNFDAVYIAPVSSTPEISVIQVIVELTQEATPEVTPEPDTLFWNIESETESQVVSFEYTATAGDVLISSGIYGLIVLLAILLGVSLWKK